jgi:hypothetical protein
MWRCGGVECGFLGVHILRPFFTDLSSALEMGSFKTTKGQGQVVLTVQVYLCYDLLETAIAPVYTTYHNLRHSGHSGILA